METNLKTAENAEMFNLHEPTEALPDQIKKNKSVVGRISYTHNPTGPSGPFGSGESSQFEVTIQNAQQLDFDNTCLEGKVKLTGSTTDPAKFVSYTGGHTAITSFSAELDGKKLVDIQSNADRIADFNLYTSRTKDQLDYMESLMGCNVNMKNNDELTFRIPLSLYGCSISTLIPTGAINSTLRFRFNINTKPLNQLFKGTTGTAANNITPENTSVLTYRDLRIVSEFIELQPLVLNKMLDLIESNNGLTIPYHAYYVDNRTLTTGIKTLNERITVSYNNVVSIAQLPYKAGREAGADDNYYRNLKWNTDPMNNINQYLVNFEGSQYYNIASNQGQSGKAEHAQALINSTRSENTTDGHGSQAVKDLDNYQVLSCNFVRSASTLSASIIDSGVNARLLSSILTTSANLENNIISPQLSTIVKFTRRIVFKNSLLDIMN